MPVVISTVALAFFKCTFKQTVPQEVFSVFGGWGWGRSSVCVNQQLFWFKIEVPPAQTTNFTLFICQSLFFSRVFLFLFFLCFNFPFCSLLYRMALSRIDYECPPQMCFSVLPVLSFSSAFFHMTPSHVSTHLAVIPVPVSSLPLYQFISPPHSFQMTLSFFFSLLSSPQLILSLPPASSSLNLTWPVCLKFECPTLISFPHPLHFSFCCFISFFLSFFTQEAMEVGLSGWIDGWHDAMGPHPSDLSDAPVNHNT